jgi:hypothetical protein
LLLVRATFVTSTLEYESMEIRKSRLTLDEDGLGADLLVATLFRTERVEHFLQTLQRIDVRPRLLTFVRGSKRWLLHLRVAESDGSRLSANRAGEILRSIEQALATEHFMAKETARAA